MNSPDHQSPCPEHRHRVRAIAGCLAQCLRNLDSVDEGLAALHVSMALDVLRRAHQLEP